MPARTLAAAGLEGQRYPSWISTTHQRYSRSQRVRRQRYIFTNASNHLLSGLMTKGNNFKDRMANNNIEIDGENTRSNTALKKCQVKVDRAARKYRISRDTMLALSDSLTLPEWANTLPVLKAEDVCGLSDALMGESEGWRRRHGFG